jgi:hypothetical protein
MRVGHWLLVAGVATASCAVIGIITVVIFYAAGDTTGQVFARKDER